MTQSDRYSSPDAPRAAAGWYPVDEHSQRYWDGYEWTNHLAPLESGQQSPAGSRQTDCVYAAIIHACGLFGSFFIPLVMWLVRKDEGFIDHHGRQAINFQISMAIYLIVSFVLLFVGIGIVLLAISAILNVVFTVVAAVKAANGEYYRIPVAIQFL